jgi:hypothetical protein
MKRFTILVIVASMCLFGLVQQASAQTIPSTRGLTGFTSQTRFLSLTGYLRWQYFKENGTWISIAEAKELVVK